MIRNFLRDESGQTATEYMLIVSVIVVAVVAAAYLFIDPFRAGVQELAADVSTILDSGKIGAGMGIGHS
jgi:Flp pilus assembly pilin Flp